MVLKDKADFQSACLLVPLFKGKGDICVRTLRQDEESARVLRGFIGQSLPGRPPRREQGESGSLQPAGRRATLIYPGGCGRGGTFPYMVRIGFWGADWTFRSRVSCWLAGVLAPSRPSVCLAMGCWLVDVCPWDLSGTFRRGLLCQHFPAGAFPPAVSVTFQYGYTWTLG